MLKKDWIQPMNVEGISVSSMWSSNYSLQTVSYALLKSKSVITKACWKPSSIAWTIWVIWSSQLRPLQKLAWNWLNKSLVSAIYSKDETVRLIGQKDATSLGDVAAISNGMLVGTLQLCGQWASAKDELNMDSSSWRVRGLNNLRNKGGMLSRSAAPLPFIFCGRY